MASASECLAAIEKAAKGELDDQELDALITELAKIKEARGAKDNLDTLEAEMFTRAEQLAEEIGIAAKIEARNRLINVVKKSELMTIAREAAAKMDDPSLGLEAAMVGVNSPIFRGRDSVDARSNAILRSAMGGMAADLKERGLFPIFNRGEFDRDISRELWDMSQKKPKGAGNAKAREVAQIIRKYQDKMVEMENRAGAYIQKREGYITRQSHNLQRMERAGADAWAKEVGPRLDWDKMEIPLGDRPKFLKSAWEAMVTGKRKEIRGGDESDALFAFKGPGNLAKKDSAHRVLIFKSADDWFDYNEKFGVGPLRESVLADFSRSARNTALMQKFGTNPRAMFDTVRGDLAEEFRTPKMVRRLDHKRLDRQFAELDGSVNHVQNHSVASFGRVTRAVQSMAKLGGAFISSIADLAATASERRYQGRTLMESWSDALLAPAKGFTGAERRRYADMIGIGIDGMIGDFMSRFAAQDDIPGRVSKFMGLYFKLNLLGPWTDSVKRGVGMMLSHDLAVGSNKAFADLPAAQKKILEQYGVDARKWEVARGAIVEHEGKVFMMPGEVENVRGAMFTGLSERQQVALREDVRIALTSLLNDRVNFASPTPGARERAILRRGMQPGTPEGEAIRFLTQFKAFPITVSTKVLGRELYGRGARNWKEALFSGRGDLIGLANFIAGGTVLGYIAMQAKELAKGRDLREASPEAFIAGMLQGGGLGIYGDLLLGQTNRFGNSMLDTLAGPGFGALADLDKIRAKAMAGEDVWSEIIRFGKGNTPFLNLFYFRAAMDYLILYQLQEMANPGYLQRMERRIKRENNQTFMFPPSQAIPRGGGDRFFEGVR